MKESAAAVIRDETLDDGQFFDPMKYNPQFKGNCIVCQRSEAAILARQDNLGNEADINEQGHRLIWATWLSDGTLNVICGT